MKKGCDQMKHYPNPSQLRLTHKETNETQKINGETLYRQSAEALSHWLETHYNYQFECLCQKEPIPLIVSHTKSRIEPDKKTYYLKNKPEFMEQHHPACRFYGTITHELPITPDSNGGYQLAIQGFTYQPHTKKNNTSSSPSKNERQQAYRVKSDLETFSIQWNLMFMRRKNNQFIQLSSTESSFQPVFPDWKALLKPNDYDLKTFHLKGSSLTLNDLYLPYPSNKGIKEKQAQFKQTYPNRPLRHCFLVQGQLLGYQSPQELQTEAFGLMKLKTNQVCYLWIKDQLYQELIQSQALSTDLSSKETIWWLTALIPPILGTQKATINGQTFAVPTIQAAALIPLAKNGWWIENEAQQMCFNQAWEQKQLIHRPSQTDYRPLIPLELAPTFYWIHPQTTPTTPAHQKYILGQISYAKTHPDYKTYWEEEKQRLAYFHQLTSKDSDTPLTLWHWNWHHEENCPSLPTFVPIEEK